MKTALKYLGLAVGTLLVIVVLAGLVLFLIGNSRLNKEYDFPASEVMLPTDEASLAYGKHRVESLCQGCHGEDLGGIVNFFDGGPLGTIDSANLTAGAGGIGSDHTTEDYVRAVRHGIGRDGKPIFMPAVVSTANFSDEDLGAIIAYLNTVPPVDRQLNGEHFSPLAKILLAAGKLGDLPVETVSHDVHVTAPEWGVTAEYGEYIVNTYDCRICHGQEMNGGRHANPTIQQISPNLTSGGELAFWAEEDFINTIRTGVTPGGHMIDLELMPWQDYARLQDDELRAVWLYLRSLPELPQYTE
jgi:mono/diheme cytochrome c family protein